MYNKCIFFLGSNHDSRRCNLIVGVTQERHKLGLTCYIGAGASPSGLNIIKLYLDAEAEAETDPGLVRELGCLPSPPCTLILAHTHKLLRWMPDRQGSKCLITIRVSSLIRPRPLPPQSQMKRDIASLLSVKEQLAYS